jgi:phospholipase C
VDWNLSNPVSATPTLDGFVETAADTSRNTSNPGYQDFNGYRAMGYYDGGDLNYYYFMASSFATSDRWFSPVMSRTQPNRMYLAAATSQGHVYPPNTGVFVTANTIFQELQTAGLTWKIYVQSSGTIDPKNPGHPCADTDSSCLINYSEIGWFAFGQQMKGNPSLLSHVQSVNQYLQDAANGTLPNVALIEPAYGAALDEHPTVDPTGTPTRIQAGAAYVSKLINTLMNSPSWKDSAFILTWDEGGGLYDHVPPFNGNGTIPAPPNPDGIPPNDMLPGDICTNTPGAPTCDFTYTGYRVPLVVVSPFTKKNYVSHTPTDYTAILKLIETRFGVPNLTKRDAWAIDMTEFFDFVNVPWATPPSPPVQNTTAPCVLTPPTP